MNVYIVTCGIYQYFAVAKNEDEAVKKVYDKHNLHHLPFKAEEIDLEGYKLVKR